MYAEIILPIAGGCYTFSVDGELAGRVVAGSAVSVQFGTRKIVGGIVWRVHGEKPSFAKIKPVLSLLFPEPIVSPAQMALWEWMAGYYMCSPGEVMRAALPAMLKPSGFTAEEFAADKFRARTHRVVSFDPAVADEAAFNEACEKLRRRAPKQYDALVEVAGYGGEVPRSRLRADAAALSALQKKGLVLISEREIATSTTAASATAASATATSTTAASATAASAGTVPPALSSSRDSTPASPTPSARGGDLRPVDDTFELPILSPAQQTALESLRASLKTNNTALLFGVPSSGKSEIYFHAIAGALSRGRDVLLLLPEISLTTQFIGRVRRVFGDRVVLYNSALSDRRRAEAWIRLARSTEGTLVVGTRSSVFLPFPRPGLVVVDEEQDSSYKQHDPAPRYNARDTAIVLAGMSGAKVILASATPSLETWANASAGKYGLVELSERWGGSLPPEIIISDTIRAARRGERRSHFNKELTDRIAGALGRGEQVILFQNRRGIAPFVECTDCGYVPRCGHCNIPMSVHRGALRCHYCGSAAPLPLLCPSCGGGNLATRGFGTGSNDRGDEAAAFRSSSVSLGGGSFVTRGFGTQKIEQELKRLFPSARIARLDRDSAGSGRAYERIIGDFENGATDILVGTQMVTKGLDFARVSLVGILNADNLVNHPDFRASERAYSLMAQVAGRAGRRQERGVVIIQTASPESRLIAQAAAGDYRAMAAELLAERAMYGYPPSTRLISVMLRHADRDTLQSAATGLGELLRSSFGERMLGPQPPVTEKIKGEYALVFLLKVPRTDSMSAVRKTLQDAVRMMLAEPSVRKTTVTVNVDPM